MTSFLVTRRALSLGAQDAITGWYAKTYTETASYDKMVIVPKGFNLSAFGIGGYAKYAITGYICAPLSEGDEIISNTKYYEVIAVEDVDLGDSHMWYMCELHELQMHWDEPAYGTSATVYDPRRQIKIMLDAYLGAETLHKNDGTDCSYITCWDGAPYPLKRVFDTKAVDLIFSVSRGTSKPEIAADKTPYGYVEKVPVFISTVNKTGISGENLWWQGERAFRHIMELYPIGSVRTIETINPKPVDLGSLKLFQGECVVNYVRGLT
jgi:hypothetical protein